MAIPIRTEVDDVESVTFRGSIVGDDHPLPRIVPDQIERIPQSSGELNDLSIGLDAEDLPAVPSLERGDESAAVIADADPDRSVRSDRRISAVMLGRDSSFRNIDVAYELVHDRLAAGDEIDSRNDVVGLAVRRVVNGGGVVVDERHPQEAG